MSTVRTLVLDDRMGPMVEPQPMSLRTTNSCTGIPCLSPICLRASEVAAVVAYRCGRGRLNHEKKGTNNVKKKRKSEKEREEGKDKKREPPPGWHST